MPTSIYGESQAAEKGALAMVLKKQRRRKNERRESESIWNLAENRKDFVGGKAAATQIHSAVKLKKKREKRF